MGFFPFCYAPGEEEWTLIRAFHRLAIEASDFSQTCGFLLQSFGLLIQSSSHRLLVELLTDLELPVFLFPDVRLLLLAVRISPIRTRLIRFVDIIFRSDVNGRCRKFLCCDSSCGRGVRRLSSATMVSFEMNDRKSKSSLMVATYTLLLYIYLWNDAWVNAFLSFHGQRL